MRTSIRMFAVICLALAFAFAVVAQAREGPPTSQAFEASSYITGKIQFADNAMFQMRTDTSVTKEQSTTVAGRGYNVNSTSKVNSNVRQAPVFVLLT